MKKLLLLGGSGYIVPIIRCAQDLGIYTITCDYISNNLAHKFSDSYENASVIDKDSVIEIARQRDVDGIMSFACDPGVLTAAFVAEKLGLPFQCSYESARILQDKGKFREFLKIHGFKTPMAESFDNESEAINNIDMFSFPVIVKPVDSAGSKGVAKVDEAYTKQGLEKLKKAITTAMDFSICGRFIIEEFLEFKGFHSSADVFNVDGKLAFVTYSDQLFDRKAENPYTPAKIIWPSSMEQHYQDELTRETQRLFDLLKMKTGIYNIETCVDVNGRPCLMEVSPRGGGCKIAEIQEMAYGVKLIENEVRKAVGMPLVPFNEHTCDGHWCEFVIHSSKDCIYRGVDVKGEIKSEYLKKLDMSVIPGDKIHRFTGANMSLGDLFLRFDSRNELNAVTESASDWLIIREGGYPVI